MAADKVCCTYELTEMILVELPFFDLLRATGVNRTFQACIKSSSKLQEKLFFKQKTNAPDHENIEPAINPAIKKVIKRTYTVWNQGPPIECHLQDRLAPWRYTTPSNARICTELLPQHRPQQNEASIAQSPFYLYVDIYLKFEKRSDEMQGKGNADSEESWRAMYLTDQACETMSEMAIFPYAESLFCLPPGSKMTAFIDEVDMRIEKRRRTAKRAMV